MLHRIPTASGLRIAMRTSVLAGLLAMSLTSALAAPMQLQMDVSLGQESRQDLKVADARTPAAKVVAVKVVPVIDADPAFPPEAKQAVPETSVPEDEAKPTIELGPGDSVAMQVYGRPEMNTTTYVADDGTMTVPLAGSVAVAGLSPSEAASRIAKALRDGQFLLRPHVTLTLTQMRSQQVSVLGEVRTPGRFPIESRTTVFDVLAQAGGATEAGADLIYVMRPDGKGGVTRQPVDLKALDRGGGDAGRARLVLRGGDSIYVPRADQFYIYGEVQQPNMYRLEAGMTVVQAIARGGGITPRGSNSRIEIRRKSADGELESISAELSDPIQPNDVVRVKERIF